MAPPDWLETIKGPVIKYGLPLIGFGVGLAVGDVIQLGTKLKDWTGKWIDLGDMAAPLAALAYFLAGLALWMLVPYIGGLVGGVLMGMALRAFTEYAGAKKEG